MGIEAISSAAARLTRFSYIIRMRGGRGLTRGFESAMIDNVQSVALVRI